MATARGKPKAHGIRPTFLSPESGSCGCTGSASRLGHSYLPPPPLSPTASFDSFWVLHPCLWCFVDSRHFPGRRCPALFTTSRPPGLKSAPFQTTAACLRRLLITMQNATSNALHKNWQVLAVRCVVPPSPPHLCTSLLSVGC